MTMIPAFGPWPEHPADADEEKRLASAQQSKTSPLSVDKEHETGVFYGSGKEPYQTSLASCTCNDFVKRKKPCKHIFRLAMELGIIDAAYKTGRSTGERNEAQISFADSVALVEQLSDAAQNAIKDSHDIQRGTRSSNSQNFCVIFLVSVRLELAPHHFAASWMIQTRCVP